MSIGTRVVIIPCEAFPRSILPGLHGLLMETIQFSNGSICYEVLIDGDSQPTPLLSFEVIEEI